MDEKESQVNANVDWCNDYMDKVCSGFREWSQMAEKVIRKIHTEKERRSLKEYNDTHRDVLLKQLPRYLYYGITRPLMSTIMRRGIGLAIDGVWTSALMLHANKFNALNIVSDSPDPKCDFYGVIVIPTKSIDLSKLFYSFEGAKFTYFYTAVIESVNFDKAIFF